MSRKSSRRKDPQMKDTVGPENMRIVVIGGGPAGMMAAVSAADCGASVILLEKNEKLGKKLYITGKGRCNLTNSCAEEKFFDHVVSNGKFLYSSIYGFPAGQVCAFFEAEGLRLKEERGGRIFPVSDKSSDVIKTMEKALQERNVQIRLRTEVKELLLSGDEVQGVLLSDHTKITADAVIVATGGLSYRSTGSTGDGYRFAQQTGHKVTELRPSLTALTVLEESVKELEGLSLRNIEIRIEGFREFGEMLFTSDGVSGPVILTASAALCRAIAEKTPLSLHIDLKPALTEEQLDARVQRDFEAARNKDFCNSLSGLLPAKLIPVIVRESAIPEHKKVNEITRAERKQLVALLKNLVFTVTGTKGFEQAVITQGGVSVKDISPSTMESKKVRKLYFAGEVMDVDAYTGGYNLQIAWSTGALAGSSAAGAEYNRK